MGSVNLEVLLVPAATFRAPNTVQVVFASQTAMLFRPQLNALHPPPCVLWAWPFATTKARVVQGFKLLDHPTFIFFTYAVVDCVPQSTLPQLQDGFAG